MDVRDVYSRSLLCSRAFFAVFFKKGLFETEGMMTLRKVI